MKCFEYRRNSNTVFSLEIIVTLIGVSNEWARTIINYTRKEFILNDYYF